MEKIILEQYKLLYQLGQGEFSTSFLAIDENDRTLHTIKIVGLEHANQNFGLAQKLEEIHRALIPIYHPKIVPLERFEINSATEELYLIFPYKAGWNFENYLRRQSSRDSKRLLNLFKQIARGLDILHRQKLAHGCIKPSNILILENETIVLMNVGLQFVDMWLRRENQLQRSPNQFYIAPERLNANTNRQPSMQEDIFALGMLMFYAFTRQYPYQADSYQALQTCYKYKIYPAGPSLYQPDLPQAVNDLVERCLQLAPEKRFKRGREVTEAIDQYLSGQVAETQKVVERDQTLLVHLQGAPAGFIHKDDHKQVYLLSPLKPAYSIGRSTQHTTADEVPEVDLQDDRTVSRTHARIFQRQGRWTIIDKSRHPADNRPPRTKINGQTLPVRREMPLQDGDVCMFGKTQLVFRMNKV